MALCCVAFLGPGASAAFAADPPTVSVTAPSNFSFAAKHATVTATVAGGAVPYTSVQLEINGVPSGPPQTGGAGPYSFIWDTSALTDGAYTVSISATDSTSAVGTSSAADLTVDNTPPLNSIASPGGSQYFEGSLPVQANASDAYGIAGVQFQIDGIAAGSPVTAPTTLGGFAFASSLDISALSGHHTLTDVATDNAGNTTVSAPVPFTAGAGPEIALSAPTDLSFASKTAPVVATVTGGALPYSSVKLLVDGTTSALVPSASGNTYTFFWDTSAVVDGSHTVSVAATDALGMRATTGAVTVTVDNSAPEATMYAPLPMPSYGYEASNGLTTFEVHASGSYGIKSVQFTEDGIAIGSLLTSPETTGGYLYSIDFDTSTLTPGMHAISAAVTDNAGNVSIAAALEIKTGPIVYLPVLNYHGITGPLDSDPDVYDQTPAEAAAQLADLRANGYQSVTLEQYETWLTTGVVPGVSKPVLITIDDGLSDELAWDPLLQANGFNAVLFDATGFADNLTPGDADPVGNMTWTQIQALVATGRWEIAFHAGQYGHGDFSEAANTVGGQSYPETCWTFYTCFSEATGTTTLESPAAFESALSTEVDNGIAELKAKIPSANLSAWACPWNACGQWTNQYNDPSGEVQAWLSSFFASKFQIVFTQTDPITYATAGGTVGALDGDNRYYRFEVLTDTTMDEFRAALSDAAFAFYPPFAPAAPTTVTATAGNAQATVTFAPPVATVAPITGYTVTASPGGQTATGPGGPLTIAGLTNGVSYGFTVTATNAGGTSLASTVSNVVTPQASQGEVTTTTTTTPVATTAPAVATSPALGAAHASSAASSSAAPSVNTGPSLETAATAPLGSVGNLTSQTTASGQKARVVSVTFALVGFHRVMLKLGTKKPLRLTVTRSKSGRIELALVNGKGQTLARWSRNVKAGKSRLVLSLPAKARHPGTYSLRMTSSTGTTRQKTLRAVLSVTLRQ